MLLAEASCQLVLHHGIRFGILGATSALSLKTSVVHCIEAATLFGMEGFLRTHTSFVLVIF